MASQHGQRLAHDHGELDELLKQLQQALRVGDLEVSHARLDLFWARLAVHIRAEHLHLFPAVLSRLGETVGEVGGPSVSEAQSTVDRLRTDHDFFMHELARAIGILRDSIQERDNEAIKLRMNTVSEVILEVAQRLLTHNEVEESQIYRWASTILDEQEQMELSARINEELANRPSRFSLDSWSHH